MKAFKDCVLYLMYHTKIKDLIGNDNAFYFTEGALFLLEIFKVI